MQELQTFYFDEATNYHNLISNSDKDLLVSSLASRCFYDMNSQFQPQVRGTASKAWTSLRERKQGNEISRSDRSPNWWESTLCHHHHHQHFHHSIICHPHQNRYQHYQKKIPPLSISRNTSRFLMNTFYARHVIDLPVYYYLQWPN